MPSQDKVLLLGRIEETLKPRMFVNMYDEASAEISATLDDFSVEYLHTTAARSNDLLNTFIAAKVAAGRTEKTTMRYRYIITRFLQFAGVEIREINADHIRAYFAAEHDRGISDRTLDGIRQVLKSFFVWLFENRKISANPMVSIDAIKCEEKIRPAFSAVELDKIKKACACPRDLALVNFLLATGCRIEEAMQLNVSDINLSSDELIVHGKGRKQRDVFFDDVAAFSLQAYLATRTDDNPALFLNRAGRRLNQGGARNILKRIEKVSGVRNIHPHRFRRTLISTLLKRGMPIQEVARLVGHAKLDTTMKYFFCDKTRIRNSYHLYST